MKQYIHQVGGAQRDHFLSLYLQQAREEAAASFARMNALRNRLLRARRKARLNPWG